MAHVFLVDSFNPIWSRPTILQYDDLQNMQWGRWQRHCAHTFHRKYSLTARQYILARAFEVRMKPIYDEWNFNNNWFFLMWCSDFLNKFCRKRHTDMWLRGVDILTVLAISIQTFSKIMFQDRRHIPYSVPQLRNIFEILMSSEGVFIYKYDSILLYTPPGDACSH